MITKKASSNPILAWIQNEDNMNFIYGMGAAVVIVGALFKLQHWPGANAMLIIGLGTEALIFAISALIVILKPLATVLNRFGTNYIFLLLCLMNAIVLYFGMQYYPDTYTIGYLLFPSSVIVFMLGAIFSVKKIDGSQA